MKHLFILIILTTIMFSCNRNNSHTKIEETNCSKLLSINYYIPEAIGLPIIKYEVFIKERSFRQALKNDYFDCIVIKNAFTEDTYLNDTLINRGDTIYNWYYSIMFADSNKVIISYPNTRYLLFNESEKKSIFSKMLKTTTIYFIKQGIVISISNDCN